MTKDYYNKPYDLTITIDDEERTIKFYDANGEELIPFKDDNGYWKVRTNNMKAKSDPLQKKYYRTEAVHRLVGLQTHMNDYFRLINQIKQEIIDGIQPPLRKAGEWKSYKNETYTDRIQVHHIDGNIDNNMPDNLELLLIREHQAKHRKG